jgi:hypothetical protein
MVITHPVTGQESDVHPTSPTQQFYARLDKRTERRVLCTHSDCDGQVADVILLPSGYLVRAP